ncbi:MAG: AI-2E family transporter [Verrucomicrobiota bacterium]
MNVLSRDLTRIVLAILALGAMLFFSSWIVRPFVPATIWAATIASATWPALRLIQKRSWGKRWIAVLIMSSALFLLFLIPLSVIIRTIVHHEHDISGWAKTATSYRLAPPPDWVKSLPLVGDTAARQWIRFAHEDSADLQAMLTSHSSTLVTWFVSEVGALSVVTSQLLLTLGITVIFYATGERAALGTRLFLTRLAGERGNDVISLMARAIRGVILGTIVAGLIVAIVSGVGLFLTGVPQALLLTAVMFLLYLIQIGTTPVLGIATIWLYASGHTTAGTILLIWTVFIVAFDQVLRAILMKMGADLPIALIFIGVVGGMAAFGLVGIFVGPVILAVSYTLLEAWVREGLLEPPKISATIDPAPPAIEENPHTPI